MGKLATARVVVAVCATAGVASADIGGVPGVLVRFGMTTGANRQTPEGAEVGPMLAAGAAAGRFTGEVNYAYLSFLDPDTRIHRAGVALRFDVWTWATWYPDGHAISTSKTVFTELGAARRWGEWQIGTDIATTASVQNEVHASVGLQLEDKWQLALRIGAGRNNPMYVPRECRGVACAAMVFPDDSGLVGSVMLEWMFLVGR